MKVYELIDIIEAGKQQHKDFENWEVALEHVPDPHNKINTKDYILSLEDGPVTWEFIKSHCMGCATHFIKEKVLGLQIHY